MWRKHRECEKTNSFLGMKRLRTFKSSEAELDYQNKVDQRAISLAFLNSRYNLCGINFIWIKVINNKNIQINRLIHVSYWVDKILSQARNYKIFQILLYVKFCIINSKRVTTMSVVLGQWGSDFYFLLNVYLYFLFHFTMTLFYLHNKKYVYVYKL